MFFEKSISVPVSDTGLVLEIALFYHHEKGFSGLCLLPEYSGICETRLSFSNAYCKTGSCHVFKEVIEHTCMSSALIFLK